MRSRASVADLFRQQVFHGIATQAVWLLSCIAGLAHCPPSHADEPRRPSNVVIILADDLGYGDLGCYGNTRYKTPHLDQMARDGARLTGFYAPVPFCAPTRASLMTGRYPPRCGLTQNPVPKEDLGGAKNADELGLPVAETTLADVFHKAGYATACFGKWHLGHQPQFRPLKRGFDEYLGVLYSNDMHPVELMDGDKVAEYPIDQNTLTRKLTDRALKFLDANKDRPFLLYLPHAMPHKPLAASDDFRGKSGAGLYGDAVQELDWGVGQVLAKLKTLKLEDRTLVVFASDNGAWYGGSSGGLRGMKGTSWEGGLRVPLIARLPGKISPGHTSAEPAVMPDLFATACAFAGLKVPDGRTIDGKDLMPLLTAKEKAGPHEFVFSTRGNQVATVRSGKWKLHVLAPGGKQKAFRPDDPWTDPRGPDGKRIIAPKEQAHPSQYPGVQTGVAPKAGLLFDLDADPAEQTDVAAANLEVVNRFQEAAKHFEELKR
ncbi:MAG TPA: sulfatase [Gemmataceae bacterium]|nr:sulfatase [Gemmataceae bacterium]